MFKFIKIDNQSYFEMLFYSFYIWKISFLNNIFVLIEINLALAMLIQGYYYQFFKLSYCIGQQRHGEK